MKKHNNKLLEDWNRMLAKNTQLEKCINELNQAINKLQSNNIDKSSSDELTQMHLLLQQANEKYQIQVKKTVELEAQLDRTFIEKRSLNDEVTVSRDLIKGNIKYILTVTLYRT